MSDLYSPPTIVVGVDGSRAATHAALWAIDEAVSRDIPLRLVYVADPQGASSPPAYKSRLSAAHTALAEVQRAIEATGEPVKIESDVVWGRPVTKLLEESRSAALVCVGSIGLNHACHGGGSVAAALARSAICPVAVIRQPVGRPAGARVNSVVAVVDNGIVLRHAFEEARLRKAPLRAIAVSRSAGDGNHLAQAQLSRRLGRWTRLYPDVEIEWAIVRESVDRYLASNDEPDQLFVTDSHAAEDLCGACNAALSVLAIRCSIL